MKIEIHLNLKNSLYVVAGIAMLMEALIPFVVSAEDLKTARWHWIAIIIACLGVLALLVQAILQSKEDHKRDEIEHKRDEDMALMKVSVTELVTQLRADSLPTVTASETPKNLPTTEEADKNPLLDGELRRIFVFPRVGVGYAFLKEVWKRAGGHQDNPKVDCDILVALYVVNSSNSIKYIKEITGSVMESGVRRTFELLKDFRLQMGKLDAEYGYEDEDHDQDEGETLTPLLPSVPLALNPEQPIDGWLRFVLKDADPEKLDDQSWMFTIVDSLGVEYSINKVSDKPKKGEIGLRRFREAT